jgi:hypothetical protein
MDGVKQQDNRYICTPLYFHPSVKLGSEQSWHHFKVKNDPITNYIQTQTSLILQYNSYLSHVRSFFKIPRNFLSLISSYPLLKMLFSTLSFRWTTAVGNRWLHNILCDFFYPFKTQGRIILGRTVLLLNSIHIV